MLAVLLAESSQAAGLGVDALVCDLIARFGAGLGGVRHQGLIAGVGDPAVLAEGWMAFVFCCAASARYPIAGEVARAEALLSGGLLRPVT